MGFWPGDRGSPRQWQASRDGAQSACLCPELHSTPGDLWILHLPEDLTPDLGQYQDHEPRGHPGGTLLWTVLHITPHWPYTLWLLHIYFVVVCVKSFSLQDSEELSSEEEMKMAEMRPPLIEISINQPKVVALSKDKKGTTADTWLLLGLTTARSSTRLERWFYNYVTTDKLITSCALSVHSLVVHPEIM